MPIHKEESNNSVNLVLFQEIPVLLNYYQLPMKFTKVLIAAQGEMLRGCVKYLVDKARCVLNFAF